MDRFRLLKPLGWVRSTYGKEIAAGWGFLSNSSRHDSREAWSLLLDTFSWDVKLRAWAKVFVKVESRTSTVHVQIQKMSVKEWIWQEEDQLTMRLDMICVTNPCHRPLECPRGNYCRQCKGFRWRYRGRVPLRWNLSSRRALDSGRCSMIYIAEIGHAVVS